MINKIVRIAVILLAWLTSGAAWAAQFALIIDDMGNTRADEQAFSLPAAVSFSILPHTPFSTEFAERAHQQQREVILHMPMEALSGLRPGPGTLTANMHPQQIQQQLQAALTSVPHAIGANNHMGSKLTQLTLPMHTVMDFLRERQLLFVDSRTTKFSKAEKIAVESGVPALHRHVFLDNNRDPKAIDRQFKQLKWLAKRRRMAIGIAHPYPETLDYLQRALLNNQNSDIKLVPLSTLFDNALPQLAMKTDKQTDTTLEDE